MRSSDEVIELLRQSIHKRREYVRRQKDKISIIGREQQPRYELALRGGMLSELSVIECILEELKDGRLHPDMIYN